MDLPSRLMETAVDQMASLPGIGRKTALRLVLNMLRRSEEQVEAFSETGPDIVRLIIQIFTPVFEYENLMT